MGDRKGTRPKNIRKMRQAVDALTTAENYLVKVGSQYEEADPDIYEACCSITQILDAMKASINAVIVVM